MSGPSGVAKLVGRPELTAFRPRGERLRAAASRLAFAVGALVLVIVLWEGYKALAPQSGLTLGSIRVLPRTTDLAMPHVAEMLRRLGEPTTGAKNSPPLWATVWDGCRQSLVLAVAGWVIGVGIGLGLALIMQRFRHFGTAALPLIVLSQTVPLIALAPLVQSSGSQITAGGFEWETWMSVVIIASYLSFFPVAVGGLRGLASPTPIQEDLMVSYAAGWRQTLIHIRLPAAVPHLIPALRLAAVGAVAGTIVGEVSTGLTGGLGRMIIEYAGFAGSDPAKPWAPIFGAVGLGLITAGGVGLASLGLARFQRGQEA